MLSRENQVAATGVKKLHRHCALRMVGRAGLQSTGSHRRNAWRDRVLHCSSAVPVSRHAVKRKPAVRKIRPESTVQKDSDLDRWMKALSSDHTYLAKPNHRRSSLPMDYRWLAGMTPKWYTKVKEQRSVLKQQRRSVSDQQETTHVAKHLETAVLGDELTVHNNTDMSASMVVLGKESGRYDKTAMQSTCLTKRCSDMYQSAGIQSHLYSSEKFVYSESDAVLTSFDKLGGKYNVDNSGVLCSDLPDYSVVLQASSVPVLVTDCNEAAVIIHEDGLIKTVRQHVDKQIVCSAGHCNVDKPEGGAVMLSDSHDTAYKIAVCCSSGCDCFGFCESFIECETDVLPQNKVDVDDLVTNAVYVGCDGRHKVTCDLHLVGALETVSDNMESVNCVVDGHSSSASADAECEDFVDNVCIDCGCELTSDDMTECVYSVPVCSICSQDADNNVPSIDDTVSADHGYACLSTDSLLCPSPQKETSSSPSAIRQQPEMPDIDVVDDVTFLSFPSKLMMHKYISCQQNTCEPAIKSSWMELARCEWRWHGGHRSHRSVWFGSTRHRHIDRFSAHNRLNEQIELGLVKPLSAQSSADLLGIKFNTCLAQTNSDRAVINRKLKCKNRHLPSNSIQRPTRVAARGQRYCLTHFRQKGNALGTLVDAERVVVMKLTQQQAKDALEPLHVPSVITRNKCSKPGMFDIVFYSSINALKYVIT